MEIPIVIPALDPDYALVDYCKSLRIKTSAEIILVDDGSADDKKIIFKKCCDEVEGIVLLTHAINMGKGRALKTAFGWLLENRKNIIGCVTADSDGQHLVDDVIKCVEASFLNPNALVMGCRVFTGDNVPWKSSFGNNWMRVLFLIFTRRNFMDTQTGLRVIPVSFMQRLLQMPGERFEFETEMLLNMNGIQLVQIPITTVYEGGNKSTHFRPLIDSWRVVKVILRSGLLRFIKFVVASLSSFAIDVLIFYVLYNFVLDEKTVGRLWWSIALARGISLIYNYIINELFVFGIRFAMGGVVAECRRFLKYLILATIVVIGAYSMTKIFNICFPNISVIWLKITADIIMFIMSYILQRVFIFKEHQ